MLDELLGRAELKDRIAELEAERDRLQSQLDAERDRRKTAVTDRQEADEKVNRLQDRIADLEGKLDRLERDEPEPEFRGVEVIQRTRLGAVLDRLERVETDSEGALTAVIDDEIPDAVRDAFGNHASLLARASPCVAVTDDAGLVSAAITAPTDPSPRVEWADQFRLERSWFEPVGEFALALVRADLFALGEYVGREHLSFTGFESDVKGNHSKGGFSQGRFERRRDAQIDEHVEKCEAAIADREADRLYVVGERAALREFDDVAAATATVDATGKPEAALEDAFEQFFTCRLYQI